MEIKLLKFLFVQKNEEIELFIAAMSDEEQMSEVIKLVRERIKCFD